VEIAAKTVGEMFEVEIIEAHHKWKRDKPSGTAKKIVEILCQDGDFADIPIHSLRLGDIPGEHYILFSGEGETLQIIHRAHSRRAFARGVPPALRFLAHAKPGCYSFRQALEK
jgi:4-hydroxy-tetrahydrodipicolinate reductase